MLLDAILPQARRHSNLLMEILGPFGLLATCAGEAKRFTVGSGIDRTQWLLQDPSSHFANPKMSNRLTTISSHTTLNLYSTLYSPIPTS